MENELDLRTDQDNHSEEALEAQEDTGNSSRNTRDSSLNSEEDLKDKHDQESPDDQDQDDSEVDYSSLSKEELVKVVKALTTESNFGRIDAVLKEVRPLIEDVLEKEKAAALEKFKAEGGEEDDFEFHGDRLYQEYESTVKSLREKRNRYYQDLEQQKNENLFKKNQVLDKLRSLADAEDTTESSFNQFKELQREWKSIGPVPNVHSRTLWANYSALVDLYYDQRSIYFELKELDRKKNLEYKVELCEKAEKLLEVESIKVAVKELNELHHEFRHTGPVPREEKDNVWARFKAASDAVYAKRDEYMASLQEVLKKNLVEKKALVEQVKTFADFSTDRIKEWNQKTKEIIDLQKKWEAVGAVPRSQTREVNKSFWSSFKAFFSNKNGFFKKLDGEREKNLEAKKQLIAKANEIKESTDWEKTSNEMKKLQQEWKETGPIPDKVREKIFAEFKAACDYFFDKRREQFGKQDAEQEENLAKKKQVCDELEKLAAEKAGTADQLYDLIDQFNDIGFVPRKAMKSIKSRFDKAVGNLVAAIPGATDEERARIEMEVQLRGLKGDPHGDRKIHHKEQSIQKQIHKAENDIAVLQNNIEFFGRSKNAEKMKSEFTEKLEAATGELKALKKQLKMLKTVS